MVEHGGRQLCRRQQLFYSRGPGGTDQVIFSRPEHLYTVTFSGSNTSDEASVRQGNVTWNLAGGSYTLSNTSPATPSLVVGEYQGTASLAVSGGALNTVNAIIAGRLAERCTYFEHRALRGRTATRLPWVVRD